MGSVGGGGRGSWAASWATKGASFGGGGTDGLTTGMLLPIAGDDFSEVFGDGWRLAARFIGGLALLGGCCGGLFDTVSLFCWYKSKTCWKKISKKFKEIRTWDNFLLDDKYLPESP